MTPSIEARSVSKRYRHVTALDGVDIALDSGSVVGLLGPNGAGKSTFVKAVCGLVRPTSGSIQVLGHPAGSRQARERIGYLAELFRFPSWLSCTEVLRMHQSLARSHGGALERQSLLDVVGLGYAADRRVEALSKGMQQRLGLAQALIGDPQIIILDEPTSALDPEGRRLVRQVIELQRDRGALVLLSSHLLAEVEQSCDTVAIVSAGKLVAQGPVADLLQVGNDKVRITTETESEVLDLPHADVPDLVARYVAEGRRILSVEPIEETLEDAYLRVIGASARREAAS